MRASRFLRFILPALCLALLALPTVSSSCSRPLVLRSLYCLCYHHPSSRSVTSACLLMFGSQHKSLPNVCTKLPPQSVLSNAAVRSLLDAAIACKSVLPAHALAVAKVARAAQLDTPYGMERQPRRSDEPRRLWPFSSAGLQPWERDKSPTLMRRIFKRMMSLQYLVRLQDFMYTYIVWSQLLERIMFRCAPHKLLPP